MKHLKTIILAMMTMFTFDTSVSAQVETRATQTFTINGGRWNKMLKNGDTVIIFSHRQNGDTHSFGIYSNDYAGVIDMKGIPFDVESKQLKKLPKKSKKNLKAYTEMARTKAREKALAGKYRTIANNEIWSHDYTLSMVSKNEPIIIVGYKESRDYISSEYYYSIVKDNSAGIYYYSEYNRYYYSEYDRVKPIDNVPLPFLPSTDDPQVKALIAKEKKAIKDREEAKRQAYYANQRKLEEERKAQQKILEEQEFEDLKLMDPAYIEIKGWKMNSAGGIKVNLKFTNCSKQTVKYVYFNGYFLNAVGDKCKNDVGKSTEWKNTGVGPIAPLPLEPKQYVKKYIANYSFDDPLFYAKTAHTFRLSSVTIEYMNGKKIVLSGAELDDRVDYSY